jgi:hypothetical protein
VIRKHLGRAATAIATAALLGAMVAAPASARTPGWDFINVKQLPDTVSPNAFAGFSFTIINKGSSNISALYLTDTAAGSPEYIANSRNITCATAPELRCAFGALNAGATIDVTVAYRVGAANFTDKFQLDSTGDPAGGNNSHGDSKFSALLTTVVSSSADFDGGFVIDDSLYETRGTLGRQNKQISSAEVGDTLIPVTIRDGEANYLCNNSDPDCARFIGEWSVLDVNGGSNTKPIKVTLLVWGGAVPGGVGANDIFLVHADGLGNATAVKTACNAATPPTNADCLVSVTKVGSNFKIVAWLSHNGGLRNAY